jgi:hypothetical protein
MAPVKGVSLHCVVDFLRLFKLCACVYCCCCYVVRVTDSYTVFGRALVNVLRGAACKPHSEVVSAKDLYKLLVKNVSSTIERINLRNTAEYHPESGDPPPAALLMSPVMFVPQGAFHLANNPICYRCGPPPAPEKPYVRCRVTLLYLFSMLFEPQFRRFSSFLL